MSGVCELCGKSAGMGNNVSHSKRRTPRRWQANIQKTHIMVEGTPISARLCTRCIRTTAKRAAQ